MEKIIRNCSLTEYNNCLGEEEINDVINEIGLPDNLNGMLIGGGVCLFITPDQKKAVFVFAPRKKDMTVDIVEIKTSKYVTNIEIAASQFLSQYRIQNPFGYYPRTHMPTTSFLRGIASYMSVVADPDEEIAKTLDMCKKCWEENGTLESIHGDPFSYEFKNGFVNIRGSAVGNFF